MSYKVLNLTTHEVIACLDDREIAISIAHQLAIEHEKRERFGVYESSPIYETQLAAGIEERTK